MRWPGSVLRRFQPRGRCNSREMFALSGLSSVRTFETHPSRHL
jgi:hypothetical protein